MATKPQATRRDVGSRHTQETLLVEGTRFGDIEVPLDRVVEFPAGLIGLGLARRYTLLEVPEAHETAAPFRWLQSIDAPHLAFVVAEPQHFFQDYAVPMDNQVLESLGLESPDEALVLLILTISGERRTATANLQGPLVLNPKRRLGRQLVLQVPGYTTRHSILRAPELERANEAKAAQKTC